MKVPVLSLLLLMLLLARVSSDPNPRPLSLAKALHAMPAESVGDGSVVLTVSPERIMPQSSPPTAPQTTVSGIELPPDIPTPENVAVQYGRLPQWFTHVLAIAPPTMTVLNTSPALADLPLSVLAEQHPIPFLLGMLTPEQLQQMSATGLAFTDLTPDEQDLLKAALPHPFEIVSKSAAQPIYTQEDLKKSGAERAEIEQRVHAAQDVYNKGIQVVADEVLYSSLRLRAYLAPDFSFDTPDGVDISVRSSENGIETTGAFKLKNGGRAKMFGEGNDQIKSYLQAPAPNTPKESDLEWSRPALARMVALADLKSVDDLVARLALSTKLELYADPRFGRQSLLVQGDLKTQQPAGDIMQALAFCVCGTWRQVGSAYVLTDDVQGLGTRRKFLQEMVQTWGNRMTEAGKAVGGHLQDMNWMHTLHSADGDVDTLSLAQLDQIHSEYKNNAGHLLWKDLPAPLQEGLRGQLTEHYDGVNMSSFEKAGNDVAQSLKPDFKVGVQINLRLAIELPTTGAMTLGDTYRVQVPDQEQSKAAQTSAPAGSVAIDKPLRGLLCSPKTPDEARAVVAKMAKMHLNLLFLDVFSGGRTYFPNTAMPPVSDNAAGVLQAALAAARPLHMPVYAVLDTLCWRKDGATLHPQAWPKGYDEDLTVSGEAPDHSVRRQLEVGSLPSDIDKDYEMATNGSQGWASPLDPAVRALLPALVKTLAATKGLAGIAFQDTTARGYRSLPYESDDEGISLGYTTSARLVYLRTTHTDPVDLSAENISLQLYLPSEGWSTSFDVSLPHFPTNGTHGDWNKVRCDANLSLLADCYAAARTAAPALPLLMRERQIGVTFDPWLDPKKPNQYVSTDLLSYPFHAISPQSVLIYTYGPLERTKPRWFVQEAADGGPAGRDGGRAGSMIFDVVPGGQPEDLLDTLDKLSVLLKPLPKP